MEATAAGEIDGCVLRQLLRKGHPKGQARLNFVLRSWSPTSTQQPGKCRAFVRIYRKWTAPFPSDKGSELVIMLQSAVVLWR